MRAVIMNDPGNAQDLIGNEVYDRDGGKIGRVGNVYVDDATHQPEWITVRTGLLGMKESFVPLNDASTANNRINVTVSKEKVKGAPRVDTEHGHLSDKEGRELYFYYGLRRENASAPARETPGPAASDQAAEPSDTAKANPVSARNQDARAAENDANAERTGRHSRPEPPEGPEQPAPWWVTEAGITPANSGNKPGRHRKEPQE